MIPIEKISISIDTYTWGQVPLYHPGPCTVWVLDGNKPKKVDTQKSIILPRTNTLSHEIHGHSYEVICEGKACLREKFTQTLMELPRAAGHGGQIEVAVLDDRAIYSPTGGLFTLEFGAMLIETDELKSSGYSWLNYP